MFSLDLWWSRPVSRQSLHVLLSRSAPRLYATTVGLISPLTHLGAVLVALFSDRLRDSRNRILKVVVLKMGWSRIEALIWFHSKSPKLGGRSPLELLEEDQEKKLRTFIEEKLKKEKGPE